MLVAWGSVLPAPVCLTALGRPLSGLPLAQLYHAGRFTGTLDPIENSYALAPDQVAANAALAPFDLPCPTAPACDAGAGAACPKHLSARPLPACVTFAPEWLLKNCKARRVAALGHARTPFLGFFIQAAATCLLHHRTPRQTWPGAQGRPARYVVLLYPNVLIALRQRTLRLSP